MFFLRYNLPLTITSFLRQISFTNLTRKSILASGKISPCIWLSRWATSTNRAASRSSCSRKAFCSIASSPLKGIPQKTLAAIDFFPQNQMQEWEGIRRELQSGRHVEEAYFHCICAPMWDQQRILPETRFWRWNGTERRKFRFLVTSRVS